MENRTMDFREGLKNGFLEGLEKPLTIGRVLGNRESFERKICYELALNEFSYAYHFRKRHLVDDRETFEKGYKAGVRTGQVLGLLSFGLFTAFTKAVVYSAREDAGRNEGYLPADWKPKRYPYREL